MNFVTEHIIKYLKEIVEVPDGGFETIFNNINNEEKGELKSILVYIDKLINSTTNKDIDKLNYVHIHIEGATDNLIKLIGEFITIKFFQVKYNSDLGSVINDELNNQITRITKIIEQPLILPSNVTKPQERELRTERKGLRTRISFLKNLTATKSLDPSSIINLQIKEIKYLQDIFEYSPFAIPLNNTTNGHTYVLLNSENIDSIRQRKYKDQYLLKIIEHIILFNCESKTSIFKEYNFTNLNNLNQNHGTNFKNLILFSFGEGEFMFHKLKNRIERIESRYFSTPKYPNYQTYTIIPNEVNLTVENRNADNSRIEFIGDLESSFWEDFKMQVSSYTDLEELTSIKMMNIYSLVLNEDIKNTILNEIFNNGDSKIITKSTKEVITDDLSNASKLLLKESLTNVLNWIIAAGWKESIKEKITDKTVLIISSDLNENELCKNQLLRLLGISSSRIKSHFDKFNFTGRDILILDYRDHGNFPFLILNNITSNHYNEANAISGLFLGFFFKKKFEWNEYNYVKEVARILNHQYRKDFFNWTMLEKTIQSSLVYKTHHFCITL